jgi:radical SAM superfamily enzyme YgiQ (UPF0313 family)
MSAENSKMLVLLINGPWVESKQSYSEQANEPLQVLSLAAMLEQEGYRTEVADFLFEPYNTQALYAHLESCHPKVVGLSSYTTNFPINLEIAENIKRFNPEIHVVFGGPHPSALPEHVIKHDAIDSVCVGEGELTMIGLCRAIEGDIPWEKVNGLWWKKNGEVVINAPRKTVKNLDDFPFPARDKIPMEKYFYGFWGRNCSLIMAGRGCPFNCVFCAAHGVFQDTRFRSPARVVDEMEHVIRNYGRTAFMFNDDTFTLKDKWVSAFLDELEKRKLDVIWKCFSRVNRVSRPMLERMYKNGCRALLFGIESGSEDMLKKIHKHIDKDGVRDAVKWSTEIGIETNGNFILGFPWDTRETMRETIEFALELPLTRTMFNIATPYPKTGLWDWALEKGIPEEQLYAFDTYLQGFGDFLSEGLSDIFTFDLEHVSREDIVAAFKYATVHTHFRYAVRELWHLPRVIKRFTHGLFIDHLSLMDSLRAAVPSTKIFVFYLYRSFRRSKGIGTKIRYTTSLIKTLCTPLSRLFPNT